MVSNTDADQQYDLSLHLLLSKFVLILRVIFTVIVGNRRREMGSTFHYVVPKI